MSAKVLGIILQTAQQLNEAVLVAAVLLATALCLSQCKSQFGAAKSGATEERWGKHIHTDRDRAEGTRLLVVVPLWIAAIRACHAPPLLSLPLCLERSGLVAIHPPALASASASAIAGG